MQGGKDSRGAASFDGVELKRHTSSDANAAKLSQENIGSILAESKRLSTVSAAAAAAAASKHGRSVLLRDSEIRDAIVQQKPVPPPSLNRNPYQLFNIRLSHPFTVHRVVMNEFQYPTTTDLFM
jgi:hypothetical protein